LKCGCENAWILTAVSRCCNWCTALNQYDRNLKCYRSMSTCHRQNTSCVSKLCYQSVYCCLIQYFLVRIHIVNASLTAAHNFDAKSCSRMNTRSAREHTIIAPAQLLRNWREQRPSNQSDLDSSVTEEVGRVYYTGIWARESVFEQTKKDEK
jgi:hypothetical protein